uniref:TUG ubiquitin-like domain-containing protein n=1 Tax=Loxodonta africana TaxID=9785 RepID=G3SY81_LOXAF
CGLVCRFQRSVLDLSLQWRFSNLPNNAKLEMVPASRSREGPENTVRIALHLDDGARLQDTFCAGRTLWELLSHFPRTRECLEQLGEVTPVCVYMRDEVTGPAALQRTTLQSLGLTGGSAIIRSGEESAGARSKTPGSPVPSTSADQAAGHPVLPLDIGGLSGGDLSRPEDAGPSRIGHTDGQGPKPADSPAEPDTKVPLPTPFVPFSGEGQRLGGPSGSAHSLMSPSTKSAKSVSSPGGPSEPKKSKPGLESPQEPEPVR